MMRVFRLANSFLEDKMQRCKETRFRRNTYVFLRCVHLHKPLEVVVFQMLLEGLQKLAQQMHNGPTWKSFKT